MRDTIEHIVIETKDHIPLDRSAVEKRTLSFRRGRSPANFHLGGRQKRMSYEDALKYRQHLADTGQINLRHPEYGDETRPSFDRARIEGNLIHVYVGLTSYPAFNADLERGAQSPEMNERLKQLGIRHFNDPWAYFQQAIGTAGLVITANGSAVIGKRNDRAYNGFFDSIAGYVLISPWEIEKPSSIDPQLDLERLAEEELGIRGGEIESIIPVGFHGHINTGEFDITYIVKVNLGDSHFRSGYWKSKVDKTKHRELALLSFDEVQSVLKGQMMPNEQFMYSTWGAMKSLRRKDLGMF
ncbi:hypothetical protein HYS31_07460 [Candidatus Woesearchaeota archaeon]|nr:hypothetical protein [Candidatus Woesearchaeota archaeon]